MEILGLVVSSGVAKTAAGILAAAWAAWRGRKAKRAWDSLRELRRRIEAARSETSPGGRSYTQREMEEVVEAAAAMLSSLAPIVSRALAKR